MKTKATEPTVNLKIDGKRVTATRASYVKSKTKNLRAFGYDHLSEQEVDDQLSAVLNGNKLGEGLNVIGAFIQGDIDL